MNNNRTLHTLRSTNATLVVLILALIAQMPHAADVFRLIVAGDGMASVVHSYSFAIALELAVLLFVVQHRHRESYAFAAVSVAMNLAYYHLHDIRLFDVQALPAWLVSIALPLAIARYSHAVADANSANELTEQKRQPRAVRTVRQSEHTEQLEVFGEQSTEHFQLIEAQPANSLADASDEQKLRYLAEVLASGERVAKTELAARLGVGRTKLYTMIAECNRD